MGQAGRGDHADKPVSDRFNSLGVWPQRHGGVGRLHQDRAEYQAEQRAVAPRRLALIESGVEERAENGVDD
jgi:hypothetical protein